MNIDDEWENFISSGCDDDISSDDEDINEDPDDEPDEENNHLKQLTFIFQLKLKLLI